MHQISPPEKRPHRSPGQLTRTQADTQRPEPINLAEYRIYQSRVAGVTMNTSPHRWRGTNRDSAASHSRPPGS